MLLAEPEDLVVSLLIADVPCTEDCCGDTGTVGDVALAADEAADETPEEIDPLAVCVDVGVE